MWDDKFFDNTKLFRIVKKGWLSRTAERLYKTEHWSGRWNLLHINAKDLTVGNANPSFTYQPIGTNLTVTTVEDTLWQTVSWKFSSVMSLAVTWWELVIVIKANQILKFSRKGTEKKTKNAILLYKSVIHLPFGVLYAVSELVHSSQNGYIRTGQGSGQVKEVWLKVCV